MKIRLVHSELRETVATYDGRRDPLLSPQAVYDSIRPLLESQPVEVFGVLLLDNRNKPFAWFEASRGTVNGTQVHPREVFGPAIRNGATSLIVAHNHPAGDPSRSAEDVAVTKRLRDAGDLLGIPVLDHVIIGDGRYSSARAEGWGGF